MLEYGYMLALNKPPALVRMVPFTEEGDGSSFWERRIIGNGTVLYTPQGGLGLALNGFKDVGAQVLKEGKEATIHASKGTEGHLVRVQTNWRSRNFLAALRANLILGEALKTPESQALQAEKGLELSTPVYSGLMLSNPIGTQSMLMTDHRDFHVVPEDYGSSCYGTEHSLKWGAARDLTISALRAYLVKRGKGSKYYAIVDGAVSNFLVQRDLTLSGATSVVVIDAKGNPETLGEFSPENTNRGT